MPTLPNSLQILKCNNTKLTTLPNLPLCTNVPITIAKNPSAAMPICPYRINNLIAKATTSGVTIVYWERKGVGESIFSAITQAKNYVSNTDVTFSFTPQATDVGASYRAVFANCYKTVATTALLITSIMTIPKPDLAEILTNIVSPPQGSGIT